MSRKRVDVRIADLEARFEPARQVAEGFPDWLLDDQVGQVLNALAVHRAGGTAQLATDREIHLLGLLCAREALLREGALPKEGTGEHRFPSGVVVSWTENSDGSASAAATSQITVEDLPEGVREHIERMNPLSQPERDLWLYQHRHVFREHRERMQREWSEEGRSAARARSAASRQGDRELLEYNRAECGLPPLSAEELARYGLANTRWGEGER